MLMKAIASARCILICSLTCFVECVSWPAGFSGGHTTLFIAFTSNYTYVKVGDRKHCLTNVKFGELPCKFVSCRRVTNKRLIHHQLDQFAELKESKL